MPALAPKQGSREWHALRAGRITASLAAACLGLDPYVSRQKAFRTIVGTEPLYDNAAMAWGRMHEAKARLDYEVATGELVSVTGFWVHPEKDWLGASPDGLVGADGLVEIKCPGSLPDKVPVHHHIQMLVQLACTGRDWCDYWAWTPTGTFVRRTRRQGIAGLLHRLEAFYLTYVVPGVEPPRKKRRAKR